MIDFEQGSGLSQEEMYNNLEKAKAGMESSYRNFKTTNLMNKNKDEIHRKKVINKVFDTMESLGLDPSDQEALSSFMEKAKQTHPEMVKVLEEALSSLLDGGENMGGQPAPVVPSEQLEQNPTAQPEPDTSQILG